MQTGFDKNPNRIAAPMEVSSGNSGQVAATVQPAVAKSGHDGRTRPVVIIDRPSESTIAVINIAIRQLREAHFIPTSRESLEGRVGACHPLLILFSIESFCKHVAAAAEAMQQEVEVDREIARDKKKSDEEKRALQKEKCAFFWDQAKLLFDTTFTDLSEKRKHKATKQDSSKLGGSPNS